MGKNNQVPIPIFFAVIWILFRVLLYNFNIPSEEKIGVFGNILAILLVCLGSLNRKVASEKKLERYAVNFKFCLRNAGIYIILTTIYIFIHYKYVNPSYLKNKETTRIEQELAKDWDTIKANTPTLKNMDITKEEYEERVRGAAKSLSSLSLNVSLYFLLLFFMSLLFSILVPIFYKKIVLRM